MQRRALLMTLGLFLSACWSTNARAQGYGRGPGAPYGASPSVPYSGGGASYLPFGTNAGGFIPYSTGPGGGLGVQPQMMPASPARAAGSMGAMTGVGTPGIGRIRGALSPLAPIRRRGLGMGPAMGAGGMFRRFSPPGGMSTMARPPVGGYPFRVPPSLVGPATSAPGMSM